MVLLSCSPCGGLSRLGVTLDMHASSPFRFVLLMMIEGEVWGRRGSSRKRGVLRLVVPDPVLHSRVQHWTVGLIVDHYASDANTAVDRVE